MGRELLYSSGYPRPYSNDAAEIDAAKDSHWFPASIDFKATADASGGGSPVSSVADIIRFLSGKGVGSLDELGIIGHGGYTEFGMGGTVTAPNAAGGNGDVDIEAANSLNYATLTAGSGADGVKNRFSAKGRIVLYGCHAGLGDSLLNDIAKTFGVCVYGFSNAITTGFITSGSRIIERGRVFVDSAGLFAAKLGPPVDQWSKDIHFLTPDKKSPGCADYK